MFKPMYNEINVQCKVFFFNGLCFFAKAKI
jgi:hypothetical protein